MDATNNERTCYRPFECTTATNGNAEQRPLIHGTIDIHTTHTLPLAVTCTERTTHTHTHTHTLHTHTHARMLPLAVKFIHSYIQTISIAPLQVHFYSEALPTQHGYCAGVSRRSATGKCE